MRARTPNLAPTGSRRRATAYCAALAGALALAGPTLAAPSDDLDYPGQPSAQLALPRGWHRGGEVDLVITGKGLFAPKDLLFYKPGIEVLSIGEQHDRPMTDRERYDYRRKHLERLRRQGQEAEAEIDYPRKDAAPGTRVAARLKIAAGAELGEYPFRVVARGGLGALMTFWVGKFPTVAEIEPRDRGGVNDRAEDAEVVEFGRTVNGYLARYDRDVYRLRAGAGERVSFEVEGARLATYDRGDYLDVQLAVRDSAGAVIAAADDSALFLEDPYLSFVAPAGGDYFVTVEESVPSGTSNLLPYRLHITRGLRPAMLYPPGGRPGQTISVRAILADGATVEQKLELPQATGAATASLCVAEDAPSGNPVRIFPGDNVLEAEPNETPPEASVAPTGAPVALNGILESGDDIDLFRVELRGGKRHTVQLFSSALGSPLDARMWIAPAKERGKRVRFDDSGEEELNRVMVSTVRERLDPAGTFTPGEDGEYVIGVEDSRRQGGELCVYRVEIAEAQQGVLSYIVPPRNNEPRRGNRVQIAPGSRSSAVIALRDAFGSEVGGEFELVAEGLPRGVELHAPRFGSAAARLPVVFEASADAEACAALVDLRVRPVGGGGALPGGFRSTVPFNAVGGNNYLYYLSVEKLAVAVVESAPFDLHVSAPEAALTQDGELAIQVRVERRPGFDAPIEINTEWLPPNCGRPSPITIEPGEEEVEYLISARRNTPPERYQVAITATSRDGDRRTGDGMYFASSKLLPLQVSQPYLSARMPRVAVEVGKTAELVATLQHIKAFEGRASARLGRLPAGVEMVGGPVSIEPGQEEIRFTIKATEGALTGSYRGVFCDLEFTEKGQTVSQRSGYGTIRVDAKRGRKVARK